MQTFYFCTGSVLRDLLERHVLVFREHKQVRSLIKIVSMFINGLENNGVPFYLKIVSTLYVVAGINLVS